MSVDLREQARRWLALRRPAVLVEVLRTRGSVPRAAGTRMLVAADDVLGTLAVKARAAGWLRRTVSVAGAPRPSGPGAPAQAVRNATATAIAVCRTARCAARVTINEIFRPFTLPSHHLPKLSIVPQAE